MPRRPKTAATSPDRLASVALEILNVFAPDGRLTAADGDAATQRFKKALIERALGAEMSHHLGYPPGGASEEAGNHRNGTSAKAVLTDDGPLALAIPRDRRGSFETQLIGKHERRFTGFDDKIIALYARGMTVREIQAFLAEMYAVEVSPRVKIRDEAVVRGKSGPPRVGRAAGWHARHPGDLNL